MDTTTRHSFVRILAIVLAFALVLSACAQGGQPPAAPEAEEPEEPATAAEEPEEPQAEAPEEPEAEEPEAVREPVVLNFVSSFPRDAGEHEGFWLFVERLQEAAPWIEIDYRGGPDVMDPLEQIEGVGTQAFDAGTMPDAYYVAQAPIAELMKFTPYLPWEERENSVFEIYQEFHRQELNVHYLGKVYAGVPFLLFLRDQIEEPDLTGLRIRVSSAQAPIVTGLGGEVVFMPAGEIYTALERGVVDGFGWASVGVQRFGWHELVGYEIAPRCYDATIGVLINADVWDGLDEETKQVLEQVTIEAETEVVELYRQRALEEIQAWGEAGVELIKFEGEEAQRVLDACYIDGWDAVGWDRIVERTPIAVELREKYEAGYGENFETAVPGGMYWDE